LGETSKLRPPVLFGVTFTDESDGYPYDGSAYE
jgi:hypothetical protein